MNKKDVTVIILTFGNYTGLENTLNSILIQTTTIKKVIISDDGSSRAFPSGLKENFTEQWRNEKRTDIIWRRNKKNLGTVKHMNRTAALSETTYIKFLSPSDCFYEPRSLEILLNCIVESSATIITSLELLTDISGKKHYYTWPSKWVMSKNMNNSNKSILFQSLCVKNKISAPATLFRKSFFEQGGFDENYHLLEDWPTWIRLSKTEGSILFLNQLTCTHGKGGLSSEFLDSFQSKKLRTDMLLCYQVEILPYMNSFSWYEQELVKFHFFQLDPTFTYNSWLKNMLHIVVSMKRRLKQILLR